MNGKRRARNEHFDPFPIVKLFAPWSAVTFLLSDLNPSDHDLALGIIDMGNGFLDLGTIRISDIEAMRGPLGLAVERDIAFLAEKTLSAYAYDASQRGGILDRLLAFHGKMPYITLMTTEQTTANARLEARLPADVHALLKRAADLQGRTLTDFVVSAAREAAVKTIEATELIQLSLEDQQRFVEAMLNPPPLAPAMQRAIKRHKRLIASS